MTGEVSRGLRVCSGVSVLSPKSSGKLLRCFKNRDEEYGYMFRLIFENANFDSFMEKALQNTR